jgi:Oxysterol-binding protein
MDVINMERANLLNKANLINVSYEQVTELVVKLKPYLNGDEIELRDNEPLDSLIKYFLSLFESLDSQTKQVFIKNECLWLPEDATLERVLKQQLTIQHASSWDYIQNKEDYRVQGAYKSGGLALLDSTTVSKIRSVGTEILKQLGKKILSGKFNLTQISFPIRCMQASTALHNSLNTFQMIPLYLTKAVTLYEKLERLKLIITSVISSFVYTSTFEKPLNPILGETLVGELEDGTQLFAEQTSHHPPISQFYIVGNGYNIHGYFNYTAKAGMNSITVTNLGKRIYEFYDGYKIIITCPEEVFSGTFLGTMRHESLGVMNFSDNEGYTGSITLGKVKGKPSDYITGVIKNSKGIVVTNLQGTYLGYLEFDGIRYWDARYVRNYSIKYAPSLISDSENRPDIIALRTGNIETAQTAKEELENIQRNDRKLRGKSHRK